jgi:uncharacterized protein YjgD (DUF1641 family)
MAIPISLEMPPRDPREELRLKLEQAPLEHAEAVLAGFEVLQGLHDCGILELVRGTIGGGDKILEIATKAANTPEAIRGIRNLLVIAKVMGSIDPSLLEKFAQAVPDALLAADRAQETEPPGLWALFKQFRGRDLRRGLAVVNGMLEAWGKNFSAGKTG